MGYYVSITDASWTITDPEGAYKAMCALNANDKLKFGGSTGNDPKPPDSKSVSNNPNIWFAWMDWNYDETCHTCEEILQQLGFETYTDPDTGYVHIEYYDAKTGDQEYFLKAIAPYSEEGSYLCWRGEDGDLWRNVVVNSKIRTDEGMIVYKTDLWPELLEKS